MSGIAQLTGAIYTLTENTEISPDIPFSLPAGYTFIIPEGLTLTINGVFAWNGSLIIHGAMINNSIQLDTNKPQARTSVFGTIQNNGGIVLPNLVLEVSGNIITTDAATTICPGNNQLNGTVDLQGAATFTLPCGSATTVAGVLSISSTAIVRNSGTTTITGSISGDGTLTNDGSIIASTDAVTPTITGNPLINPVSEVVAETTSETIPEPPVTTTDAVTEPPVTTTDVVTEPPVTTTDAVAEPPVTIAT
jgi:hypothetical protein